MQELTHRQQIVLLLQRENLGARDLSQALGLPEKEIYDHLEHIARTARHQGLHLELNPGPVCLACGYTFKNRQRLTPPGRCPKCRATHIAEALFALEPL
jgi:transcriptional regulator